MDERTAKNYSLILYNILNYIPSRILIILNSIIIIPIFAHILNEKQMSIYLVAIQILNIILTCSFDWITKAVLRFHEKYKLNGMINSFFSSIFWISIIAYAVIFLSYFLFKDFIQTSFAIDNLTFLITIFLVIPCSIRQFLYQILRVKNQAKLYNLSILLYQIAFITLFLVIFKVLSSAFTVLIAMNIAICLIDFYILWKVKLDYKMEMFIDSAITKEILKYSLPLIFTNSCYWFMLHFSKLLFQNMHEYLNTAIVGVSWMFSNSFIYPLMTVFMFASFPVIIKKFEHKKVVKQYFTNILQLYCFILLPVVSIFCYFSKEITALILPQKYAPAAILLPFFTISVFIHELVKLINIKYHLKVKTYLEMLLAGGIAICTYFLNTGLINKYSVEGAGFAMLAVEIILIIANLFTIKNLDYINYGKIAKTFFLVSFTGLICFFAINASIENSVLKILVYIIANASLCIGFRKQILS